MQALLLHHRARLVEWQHAYRQVVSGADGTENRIDADFKFYF